jgi:hypothetical protein
LLSLQDSFAGEDDLPNANFATVQPFGFYQIGGGTLPSRRADLSLQPR